MEDNTQAHGTCITSELLRFDGHELATLPPPERLKRYAEENQPNMTSTGEVIKEKSALIRQYKRLEKIEN